MDNVVPIKKKDPEIVEPGTVSIIGCGCVMMMGFLVKDMNQQEAEQAILKWAIEQLENKLT